MAVTLLNEAAPDRVDALAKHPLQSWAWGEARARMGTEIVRVIESHDGNDRASFLMTVHPLPGGFTIGYVPRSEIPSPEVFAFLAEYALSRRMIFIKFEPDADRTSANETAIADLADEIPLKRSSHQLFPNWTMQMDLSPSEEELLSACKQKTRYNIRLAAKKGVVVEERTDYEGFEEFKALYFETTKRQGYYGHNEEYHRTVWDSLKGEIAHILVARYESTPLAAYELFLFKDTLYYPYGGSSDKMRNLMAANLLMWEAIRFGKKNGATTFDMWGSSSPDAGGADAYGGFTRFKEGYNARFVEKIGSYDLVTNGPAYSAYSIAHRLRNIYLSWRHGA
jgi:lipid II:glycine glycyltransferase (peptidoglycan interpeptide bridge formation enzyme)